MAGTANPQGAVHIASAKMAPVMRTELKASDRASVISPPAQIEAHASGRAPAKKRGFPAKVTTPAKVRLRCVAPPLREDVDERTGSHRAAGRAALRAER